MKKQSAQSSFNVLSLNLLLAFGAVASVHAGALDTPTQAADEDPCSHASRNKGALIGGLVGLGLSIIGKGDTETKAMATVVGAGVGGLIGNEMDLRRCELDRVAKNNNLTMEVVEIKDVPPENTVAPQSGATERPASVGLSVSIIDKGEGQFLTASDKLLPGADTAFREIAAQYVANQNRVQRQLDQLSTNTTPEKRKEAEASIKKSFESKRILLIGHTDDTGNSRYNANLSERRARAVASVFQSVGIPSDRITYQGAGETLPIGDNHTEEGRAKNRRVEIVDLSDEDKFQKYLASRKPNVNFYRTLEQSSLIQQETTPDSIASSATQQSKAKKPHHENQEASSKGRTHKDASTIAVTQTENNSAKISNQQQSIDFGGEPLTPQNQPRLYLGKLSTPTSVASVATTVFSSVVSSANASDDGMVVSSCTNDRPRVSNGVKSLRNDKEIHTTDEFMPGMYGTSWYGTINNHLVALTNVAVLRDGAAPSSRPTLLVYRDYVPGQKRKADVSEIPEVNTYRGDKALLYRVFPVGSTVRCMDIVIPNATPTSAPGSWVYQEKNGKIFEVAYSAKLTR